MEIGGNRPGSGRRRGVMGFTIFELLTVMMVIGVLAAIAVPSLRGALLKAEAAEVVGDLNVIKVAVLTCHADHYSWPNARGRGQIPPELVEYLPEGFSFQKDDYVLGYENWSRRRRAPFNIGLTFVPQNEELGLAVMELLGSSIWSNGGNKFTWIIDG